MYDAMPTGWMSADEARKWSRRGVWAWRGDGKSNVFVSSSGELAVSDGETWCFLCAHPDDIDAAPAVETVARWCAVTDGGGVSVHTTETSARHSADTLSSMMGRTTHVVRVLLPLPARVEPVTVRGEVKS